MCSRILDKNTPPPTHPSEFLPDSNTEYTSGDTRIFSQLHPPLLIDEHKHPFGIKNPKFQCFFNSVLQLIFSNFRNNSYTSPFNSCTKSTILKCFFYTTHNAHHSKDVDALKFQLVRHDTFYNGQHQQDSTECLLMLINIIHKGSLPDSNSTPYPMGASLSDILFSFVLEKYIVCDVCGLRPPPPPPSCESSSVLYISPTDTSSMQNLILQGLQQKLQKSCSRCNKNTWHVESSYILQPPKYLLLFVKRFRYINKNVTKDRCSIPMDTTVRLGPLKFSLRATIDHHGPSIQSGHFTESINCCPKKTILLQRSHNYGVWNYWQQKLLYCICYTIWIDWHMIFGLEQEGGSLIAPMALAHPLHPIDNRSRNRRRNLWVGWCVSSWWPLFPSRSSVLIYIYIHIYMLFYTSSIFFDLPIMSCSLMIIV